VFIAATDSADASAHDPAPAPGPAPDPALEVLCPRFVPGTSLWRCSRPGPDQLLLLNMTNIMQEGQLEQALEPMSQHDVPT